MKVADVLYNNTPSLAQGPRHPIAYVESGMRRLMQHMQAYMSDLPKETLIQGPKIYKALVLNDWLY